MMDAKIRFTFTTVGNMGTVVLIGVPSTRAQIADGTDLTAAAPRPTALVRGVQACNKRVCGGGNGTLSRLCGSGKRSRGNATSRTTRTALGTRLSHTRPAGHTHVCTGFPFFFCVRFWVSLRTVHMLRGKADVALLSTRQLTSWAHYRGRLVLLEEAGVQKW